MGRYTIWFKIKYLNSLWHYNTLWAFLNDFDYRSTESGMLSLYKNPTRREIKEARDESRFNSVRGVILENGGIIPPFLLFCKHR